MREYGERKISVFLSDFYENQAEIKLFFFVISLVQGSQVFKKPPVRYKSGGFV